MSREALNALERYSSELDLNWAELAAAHIVCDHSDEHGVFITSHAKFAERWAQPKSSVRDIFRRLRKKDFLQIIANGRPPNRACWYRINLPTLSGNPSDTVERVIADGGYLPDEIRERLGRAGDPAASDENQRGSDGIPTPQRRETATKATGNHPLSPNESPNESPNRTSKAAVSKTQSLPSEESNGSAAGTPTPRGNDGRGEGGDVGSANGDRPHDGLNTNSTSPFDAAVVVSADNDPMAVRPDPPPAELQVELDRLRAKARASTRTEEVADD